MDKEKHNKLKKIKKDVHKKAINGLSVFGKIFYYLGVYKLRSKVGVNGNHFTREGFHWWNPLTWIFMFVMWAGAVCVFAFYDFWNGIHNDLKTHTKMDGEYVDDPIF